MESDSDPFPPSLPPHVLDSTMTDAMGGNEFDLSPTLFPTSGHFTDSCQSSKSLANNDASINPTLLSRSCTESLESSPYSTSSTCSSTHNHERNRSSDSSRSGALDGEGDLRMKNHMPAPNGILIGLSPTKAEPSEMHDLTEFERSNFLMENDFDFANAADNPDPYLGTEQPHDSPSLQKTAPFWSGPGSSHTFETKQHLYEVEKFPQESPRTSAVQFRSSKMATSTYPGQVPLEYRGPFSNGAIPNVSRHGPYESQNGTSNKFRLGAPSASYQRTFSRPFASPGPTLSPTHPRPVLELQPLPERLRVETQTPVTLILHSMVPGISGLHLQPFTVAKAKQLASDTSVRSKNTLELYTMLVCTSAMLDEGNKKRALIRAAGPCPYNSINDRKSQSGGTGIPEGEDTKPLDGAPVHICESCMKRERARALRKKLKDSDKEDLWRQDEAKRIIMFNTEEVQDLPQKSPGKSRDKAQSSNGRGEGMIGEDPIRVVLPMRIACYCRHHEEETGFQVIFTIKDHEDNVIMQEITTSIYMTDDHKSKDKSNIAATKASTNTAFPTGVVIPAAERYSQVSSATYEPVFQNPYLTTDLLGMQRLFNEQQISPYAFAQTASHTTSANITPKPLSRQASPSALSGQRHKKRKASTSDRIPHELTMTKMSTSTPPAIHSHGTFPTGPALDLGSGGMPISAHSYGLDSGKSMSSMHSPYSTQPTSPCLTDGNYPFFAPRSQSMENLQGAPQPHNTRPTTHSARQSCVSSPTSAIPNSELAQNFMQTSASTLPPVRGGMQHQITPVIYKLTPAEGPKAGGIEVTCLGSGFHQGLEVMFGEAKATTTTFWGESALVCLVPPALRAGIVPVTFKNDHEQSIYPPPVRPASFKYIDDDEQQLMKQALALINDKWNGTSSTTGYSARDIINLIGGNAAAFGDSSQGNSQQGNNHQNSSSDLDGKTYGTLDLEMAILGCLNLVDLDDGPFQANFNAQGSNGQGMLHLSASLGYYRLTAGLLARGANPDIRDHNGMSPMHLASLRSYQKIIRKLRSAGADSTLRSLNGFTPADMATSQEAYDASSAFDQHYRSKSSEAISALRPSRTSSAMSSRSSPGSHGRLSSQGFKHNTLEDWGSSDGACVGAYKSKSQPATPLGTYARSRRNSVAVEQEYSREEIPEGLAPNASFLAANPAMSAWREQLSAQIQQLQQTVHRTLPNIQIPTLPPIPNLPDYRAYPAVRRISSLVPHLNTRPRTVSGSSVPEKEAEYRWWEILTGATSSPPAYEDLYPQNTKREMGEKEVPALRAAGEALMDHKCEAIFDHAESSSILDSVDLGNSDLTAEQRDRLRIAHERKVKRLRNDRNLIMIWIPLLILVLVAMLKDRVPQGYYWARQAFNSSQRYFQERVVEAV